MNFSWVPIFEELADKIKGYENRQKELIDLLRNSGFYEKGKGLEDKDSNNKTFPLQEIDPFSFYSLIVKFRTNNKKIEILKYIKEETGLKSPLPDDFNGVPSANPQNCWHFSLKNQEAAKTYLTYGLCLRRL